MKHKTMKGIQYLTDEQGCKTAVVIDIRTLLKNEEAVQDELDLIVAESRKNEPKVSWSGLKKQLVRNGKL